MRKSTTRIASATAALAALSLLVAGCGTASESTSSATDAAVVASPEDLDYESLDFNDIPGPSAAGCDSRTVTTTDGPVALKNADVVDGEINFYFAPEASTYNSYTFQVQHDSGSFHVESLSAGQHQAYTVNQDGARESHPTGLGSAKHSYSFTIPAAVDLGPIKWVSAAVNGEHAGTCHLS